MSFTLVDLLHTQWTPGKTTSPAPKVFTITPNSQAFTTYFDEVQEQLETLASMDDLLSGIVHEIHVGG